MRIALRARDGSLRGWALVDDDDADRVAGYGWCLHGQGYVHARIDGRHQLLHRVVLGVRGSRVLVDHRNGDRRDCRRHNLRVTDHSGNGQNRVKLESRNTSGYRGVSWDKRRRKWAAQAHLRGRHIFLGYHETAEGAANAAARYRAEYMPLSAEAA